MTTTPRATAEIAKRDDEIVVTVAWDAPVDRNRIQAWALRSTQAKLAQRLKLAVDAQAVCTNPTILKDVDGKTYVGSDLHVIGRTMNADLARLGY